MVDETNALASVFEKHGVVVHHTEPYTDEILRLYGSGGYCDGWAKDSFETVGPYWPLERRHIESRDASIEFPYQPVMAPAMPP